MTTWCGGNDNIDTYCGGNDNYIVGEMTTIKIVWGNRRWGKEHWIFRGIDAIPPEIPWEESGNNFEKSQKSPKNNRTKKSMICLARHILSQIKAFPVIFATC